LVIEHVDGVGELGSPGVIDSPAATAYHLPFKAKVVEVPDEIVSIVD